MTTPINFAALLSSSIGISVSNPAFYRQRTMRRCWELEHAMRYAHGFSWGLGYIHAYGYTHIPRASAWGFGMTCW